MFPAPVVLTFRAQLPNAEFLLPVVLEAKAFAPTLVLEATLPPPSPTHTPLNIESALVFTDPETFINEVAVLI